MVNVSGWVKVEVRVRLLRSELVLKIIRVYGQVQVMVRSEARIMLG